MCLQCLSINKNKDQQLYDTTASKNKDVDSEESEQVLNKT